MEKRITVIGCGATGLATAAWYTSRGFSVILADTKEQFTDLAVLKAQNGIRLCGALEIHETVPVFSMETDIPAAVSQARIILVCVSAGRQKDISHMIAPVLKDGQTVLFTPGNLGSIFLKSELGPYRRVMTAELCGNLWACRLKEPGTVIVALPPERQRIAAYPSSDTPAVIEALSGLLEADPASNILEAVLNSPNLITHLAGTLLNIARIEQKKEQYALFADGLSESVILAFKQLEKERNAVLSAYGLELYKKDSCEGLMRQLMREDTPEHLLTFKYLTGPSSMQHRYITEDASCGVALLVSMARAREIPVPLTESLLTMASVLNQTDYYVCGRTLNSMNI